jgi:hypothetical protein
VHREESVEAKALPEPMSITKLTCADE